MMTRSIAPKALGAVFLLALVGTAPVPTPAPAAEPADFHALASRVASSAAAAADCTVSCSAPIHDDDAKQWYVVVTNGCNSTAHVDVRNNGVTYGIDCQANSDSPKLFIGRTLADDYKVLKIKLVN